MDKILIISGIGIWYLIGCLSFCYWWTKDYDLTIKEIHLILITGLAGVFTWFIGRHIHKDDTLIDEPESIVIFKHRK